jgi:N-acetylneuraminate synthase
VRFRRSLYFVKALKAGEVVTADAIRSVRPGFGAPPKLLEEVIGKRLKAAVSENSRVDLDQLG